MKKQRMTKQRSMILRVLKDFKGHPTAYQIHEAVKKDLPRLSLGTVYRNLEILCGLGLVRQIKVGNRRRFDADLSNHNHIRCISCGKVDDFPAVKFYTEKSSAEINSEYKVLGHRVDFYGVCGPCQDKDTGQEAGVTNRKPTSN